MSIDYFQQQLENSLGMKLKLTVNDNRSTMLSVKWEPNRPAKVSVHRFFLKAPQNVMEALTCLINGKKKGLPLEIKKFIDDNVKKLNYTHQLKKEDLIHQGSFYNLKTFYEDVNRKYFAKKLSLNITWFGNTYRKNKSRITFGLYNDPLKLIKIHRLLDSPSIPDYVVSFVIYHEMLHSVCPSYVDERGLHRIHSKEFKERESQFQHYSLSQKWFKENHESFFQTKTTLIR